MTRGALPPRGGGWPSDLSEGRERGSSITPPRLLVTGFSPFPGAPENPTEALMHMLAEESPEAFGASAFRAIVLPTDYRRSWDRLRRLYSTFAPDIVVHFGLSARAECIHVEQVARNCVDLTKPDAAGFAPASGFVRRAGPETLAATLPAEPIVAALRDAGFAAQTSDDAGSYVCNATLYRSLLALSAPCLVGFVHVPPKGKGFSQATLCNAVGAILRAASAT
jgi:pyroglutamyl-peptidase